MALIISRRSFYCPNFATAPPGPRFINDFSSPADEAEHFGFIHLLNGIYGHLRNDRAHRARLGSEEKGQDFLDAMAMISYAHRVIDRSWLKGQA